MKCPVDGETLTIAERSGVEIDYCPKCRGVWLDRGELDKIIDRADAAAGHPSAARYSRDDDDDDRGFRGERTDRAKPKQRRESVLGELFDFF